MLCFQTSFLKLNFICLCEGAARKNPERTLLNPSVAGDPEVRGLTAQRDKTSHHGLLGQQMI
ncbi:hypothetical protein GCM10008938_30230 [Deinococcus roseus]|uniref:Uncharacterized protein n=1 Tax=Deinococcus roseus TaxID=392414 RepID=A0ABQ2D2S9_9DEIO|nr:hypothetical protein GCM10008938_30230 [Deinococcus roseus]